MVYEGERDTSHILMPAMAYKRRLEVNPRKK